MDGMKLTLVLLAAAAVLLGCGEESTGPSTSAATHTSPAAPKRHAPKAPTVEPARCPPAQVNCRSATGRIIYVEAVDPDGDGDAHFVLDSKQNITGAGLSVIDVERDMRPSPLPEVGDVISAAGPVYTGSYGQRQIQASVLHVARR
jgi:hypothetical protein